jgi:hypothetical protein
MKKDTLKLVKPKGRGWVLDKTTTLLALERALEALGYDMQIRTRNKGNRKEDL